MARGHSRTVNIQGHDDWAAADLAVFYVCFSSLGRVQEDIEWFAAVRTIDSNLLKLVHQRKFFIGMPGEKTTSDRVEAQAHV